MKIKRLRKDLKKARKAAGLISEREFDHIYITAAEAAEILGISLEEFENLDRKPTHMDFGEDIGLRYWRDWTEARQDGRFPSRPRLGGPRPARTGLRTTKPKETRTTCFRLRACNAATSPIGVIGAARSRKAPRRSPRRRRRTALSCPGKLRAALDG